VLYTVYMTTSQATGRATYRYLEDFIAGSVDEFGPMPLSQHDIIAFAEKYDPQYFHTDPDTAVDGPFGGLVASGWQTACVMMRLYVDNCLSRTLSLGSPGIDELRFHRPVRPGDALSVRVSVLEVNRSRSKPDRGAVHSFFEVMNQKRELVLSMKAITLVRCRNSL
jgi:acyl dehydratase